VRGLRGLGCEVRSVGLRGSVAPFGPWRGFGPAEPTRVAYGSEDVQPRGGDAVGWVIGGKAAGLATGPRAALRAAMKDSRKGFVGQFRCGAVQRADGMVGTPAPHCSCSDPITVRRTVHAQEPKPVLLT
jgi:hypothetical protein